MRTCSFVPILTTHRTYAFARSRAYWKRLTMQEDFLPKQLTQVDLHLLQIAEIEVGFVLHDLRLYKEEGALYNWHFRFQLYFFHAAGAVGFCLEAEVLEYDRDPLFCLHKGHVRVDRRGKQEIMFIKCLLDREMKFFGFSLVLPVQIRDIEYELVVSLMTSGHVRGSEG